MFNKKGFTLIEILVALFIFAIISVIISFALENIFNAKRSIRHQENHLNTLQMGLLLTQRDLSQMVYAPNNNLYVRDASDSENFKGTANSLTFITDSYNNPLGFEKRSNLQRVEYHIVNGYFTRTIWNTLYPSKKNLGVSHAYFKVNSLKIRYTSAKNLAYKQWPPVNFPSADTPKSIQLLMNSPDWGLIQQTYNIRNVKINVQS